MPIPALKIIVMKPKAVISLSGTILYEVIPLRAKLVNEMKLNFDVPKALGLTSNLT